MLASFVGASQASAAERPDAAPESSASAAAPHRAPHSVEGTPARDDRAARTAEPAAAASTIRKTAAPAEKAAAPVRKAAASAKEAAASVKREPAPVENAAPAKKAAAPAEKLAAPLEKTAAPAEKTAAPLEKTAAPAEKTAAPFEKTAASAKKAAASSAALGSAVAASDTPQGTDKAKKNGHALPLHEIDRAGSAASSHAAEADARQGQHEGAADAPRGQVTTHQTTDRADRAVALGTHHHPTSHSTPYAYPAPPAAAPAAAPTAGPVTTAESAPAGDQLPGPALSAAASSGCATASGASSILSLAGDVTGLASRHALVRLSSIADAADRPLAGPAATTDCPPD